MRRRTRHREAPSWRSLAGLALAAAVLATGCGDGGGEASGQRRSLSPRSQLAPEVAARLDSGTVAYRADDYAEARRHYRRATELAPDLASAWFGVLLAERALGNDAAADSIEARLEGVIEMGPHGGGADSAAAPVEGGSSADGADGRFHGG